MRFKNIAVAMALLCIATASATTTIAAEVVYGAIGNVSIAGLFLGGIAPGLMIGFG
jgi:C4-dicarboxylate transporter, DctM subunit